MELTDELAAATALPGDPDLTLDLAGVTITAAVREGPGLLVHATGGYGFCHSKGNRVIARFATGDRVNDLIFTGHFPDTTKTGFDHIYATLCRWLEGGDQVRVCCAPGRHTLVLRDTGSWILLPGHRQRPAV